MGPRLTPRGGRPPAARVALLVAVAVICLGLVALATGRPWGLFWAAALGLAFLGAA